jgi:NAD(P)-dependent dehydrogenase (short-subunit alcohol dehydrogenase family)
MSPARPRTRSTVRVALVTGGSRGLGQVLSRFLAGQGYHVILTARGKPALHAAAKSLSSFGTTVQVLAGDVADPTHRSRVRRAVEAAGRLDLLINNASELGPTPLPRLADYPLRELAAVYSVNVLAPVALTQLLRPWLHASRGMIVNISSDAALGGYPGWGGYGASKAALDLISLTLAHELAGEGISVVAVDPGDMRTGMHQAAFPGEDISDRPEPDVTLPFWAWLFGQEPAKLSGHRFRAQADHWEVPA